MKLYKNQTLQFSESENKRKLEKIEASDFCKVSCTGVMKIEEN
jgi:hypothetical protein